MGSNKFFLLPNFTSKQVVPHQKSREQMVKNAPFQPLHSSPKSQSKNSREGKALQQLLVSTGAFSHRLK